MTLGYCQWGLQLWLPDFFRLPILSQILVKIRDAKSNFAEAMSHVYSVRFQWTPRCYHKNCNFSSCLLFNVKTVFGANAFLYLAATQIEDILIILKNKAQQNSFNPSPDNLYTVTTQHLRRGVPRPKVLPSVTSDKCINSMTLPWVIWMLHCQHKLSHVCALFKAYSGEQAWKAIGDRLKRPYYLSRVNHKWKIRNRRQRTDIRKYSFVNRTIWLWNRFWNWLPAEILGTLPCKPNTFRKRVRKVINVVNWRKWKCVENYQKV